jgi:hypothetical protein
MAWCLTKRRENSVYAVNHEVSGQECIASNGTFIILKEVVVPIVRYDPYIEVKGLRMHEKQIENSMRAIDIRAEI